MKEKRIQHNAPKRMLVIALSLLLLLSLVGLITSSVLSKYRDEQGEFNEIIGSGNFDLSYQMRDPYLVDTVDELKDAIQYNYSYIQLVTPQDGSDWVFSGDETLTLNQPLTIDLNGQTLIRNGEIALLEIPEGSTLTIVDNSKDKTGGFYNPVGSVFSIEGGSMLVMGGKIESGPRYWEYYTYSDNEINQSNRVSLVDGSNKSYDIKDKNGIVYPFISYPTTTSINGNIYFDRTVGSIPADTYCYYICSDGSTSMDADFDTNFADFSYSYYIDATTKDFFISAVDVVEGTDLTNKLRVDIYGYKENIASAKGARYSAVSMTSGGLVVNAEPTQDYKALVDGAASILPRDMKTGCFISYFGVENTSCIYMSGGEMHVENAGAFTTINPSLIPNADGKALAAVGRGECICTSATNTGKLLIENGVYRSYNNRTIDVLSGNIEVKGGTFDMLSDFETAIDGRSAIHVRASTSTRATDNSTCKIDNALFRIKSTATSELETNLGYKGGNACAIFVEGGTINANNVDFEMHGDYITGLYILGGETTFTDVDRHYFRGSDGCAASYQRSCRLGRN